jgi:hypothetical protein
MSKGKVKSSGSGAFAAGGGGKMFGKQAVGTKTPFVTGKADKNSGGKFQEGGSGKMFGKQSVTASKKK